MNKKDLASRLAKQSKTSPAQAAEQLDRIVYNIVKSLREGMEASLPGLGKFAPGGKGPFRFEGGGEKPKAPRAAKKKR